MREKREAKKAILDKTSASNMLRVVPRHEGFHFYKGPGDDTGKVAMSLVDFADKARSVDIRSVNFHFTRQDFEKWIRNVLGDVELSRRVGRIRKESHGEKLRNEIIQTVKNRIEELKSI
jgi:hypothetical protein